MAQYLIKTMFALVITGVTLESEWASPHFPDSMTQQPNRQHNRPHNRHKDITLTPFQTLPLTSRHRS
jgi:hypothetical protein